MTALVVIAKAPVPGRVKTRLVPPCTPHEAASLAAAALADTLDAAAATAGATRRVLVLEGSAGGWRDDRFTTIPQRGDGLDERLASAFEDVGGPAVLIGMDTPQVTPALLERAIADLAEPGVDAVLGSAGDGGYWIVGLRRPSRAVFEGVPMSADDTLACQRARLAKLGLRWRELPALRDVDDIGDALAVAGEAPRSHFARTLAQLDLQVGV